MTVLKLSELVKAFEEAVRRDRRRAGRRCRRSRGWWRWAAGAAATEEKTEFDAVLTDVGADKILVIKAVRELPAWASRRRRTSSTPPPRR